MIEAFIQPKLLNWAMERSSLPPDAVARSAQIKPEQLTEWQKGESLPTFRQAQKLAHVLRVPFGYLFLSSIPKERLSLPDLRTIRNAGPEAFSPDFLDLLNDTLRKQQWYQGFLLEEGHEPLEFVGRYEVGDGPEKVAEDISRTLGINEKLREEATSWESFLTKCIRSAEAKGILILRSGIVGNNTDRKLQVDEFRGFAISDDVAPLIFLNGRDYKVAQIFTLAHELAHIWIGQSGISNVALNEIEPGTNPELNIEIEYFCNHVAAELLTPREKFLSEWQSYKSFDDNLKRLVYYFRVSTVVILRRSYELGKIGADEYYVRYQQEIGHQRARQDEREEPKGGDFYNTLLARNSNLLTSTIMMATYEGRLPYRDAANLLGVKITTLDGIAKRLEIR